MTPVAWKPNIMMKGRKMDPRPSSTSGSLSFSSGAIDSKSLAKNSSGSLAAVRGLRCVACVDGASTSRRRLGLSTADVSRTRARASGPGPAGRLGASRLCGVIAPRARTRRRRPARGAGVVTPLNSAAARPRAPRSGASNRGSADVGSSVRERAPCGFWSRGSAASRAGGGTRFHAEFYNRCSR